MGVKRPQSAPKFTLCKLHIYVEYFNFWADIAYIIQI